MQHSEAGLGYKGAPVQAHSALGSRYPNRVAGEQVVVFRGPEEADDTQLNHHLVNQFLRLLLCKNSLFQVLFDEDVEEGADASDGHCSAVLVLDCCEVGEIDELHSLACVLRRPGHVKAVGFAHLDEVLERCNLLADFLALTYAFFRNFLNVKPVEEALLFLDEVVHAVERHSAVVSDDASASVSVRQSGDYVRMPCCSDVGRVCGENTFVMCLAVLGINFFC